MIRHEFTVKCPDCGKNVKCGITGSNDSKLISLGNGVKIKK